MRFILAALGLLAAAPSFAQSVQPGAYLSAELGYTSISSKYADNSGDANLGLAIGYQATPNLAVELYTRGLNLTPLRGAFEPVGYYPDSHYGIAALATVPINEQFRAYGRFGVGRTKMKGNRVSMGEHSDTDPIVGAGVGYALSRNWSLSLEASYLTKSEVTMVNFGARYQF
ncbi:hypothetical protein GCM10027277_59280 [Pseudoduganella ginsengisoli]|uniref:Outer membrane beta-barrel protein n=1 Tax=Pseudoduganella ginsengisoli TaxID=1462440 RepID=A0A6L6QAT7_9BURK|nr:porin family protein [Pseudoduganella ginsengisoli]MTW06278.1 outer membrane beta-barrel protein [Pseudoduganella ginsengisoli]